MTDEPKLTEQEHKARAMLMGMRYHGGNGFPMYFEVDEDGVPIVDTMIDAHTLKPIFEDEPELAEHARYLVRKASKEYWK